MPENISSTDVELLNNYSKECGVEMTVGSLIDAHRSLVKELNNGQRKEHREAFQKAIEEVKEKTMDSTWIKIDELKTLTLAELYEKMGGDIDVLMSD